MNRLARERFPERVFMLGVGGMGMAPLAIFLAQAGCQVSGYDDAYQAGMEALLRRHGVTLAEHSAGSSARTCVFSSAFAEDNPVLAAARQEGAEVLRRGQLLARLARQFRLLAVAGSHGKTSTTGRIIHLLEKAGIHFSYVLGARFRDDALAPARYDGAAAWLVAEVDESDGTIEDFQPEVTVLVNFDWDHADRYSSADAARAAFERLVGRTRGRLILPQSYGHLLEKPAALPCLTLDDGEKDFREQNSALARLAALQIAPELPAAETDDFPGIARRQDLLLSDTRISIWADYAHHPAEIEALLAFLRSTSDAPLVAVFQPHRYSRTAAFAAAFARALGRAESVYLLPVYAASESPLEGGQSENILACANESWQLLKPAELPARLSKELAKRTRATVCFIGAGDIDQMAQDFVADWKRRVQLLNQLSAQTQILLGEPLARRTTLRVGGPARFFAQPASLGDLQQLLRNAHVAGLKVFFLGRGSNLIVSDAGFDGLVIHLGSDAFRQIEVLDGGRLHVGAGVRLKELCGAAIRAGLGGFEFLEGIPGTVGGSLRMNAGAMGGWIFDVVESVDFVGLDGALQTWPKERFQIAYRSCHELAEAIAVGATLRSGKPGASDAIRRRMDTYAEKRKESQPREPSAGCIFKNPDGYYAGKLVDELGLKGASIGGATVSALHGNFIVNRGEASSADVTALVRHLRERVQAERGITLEPEVLLLGEDWKEVLA